MGMFDEIRCEAPLPDGYDRRDTWFQTKSFPAPCLQRYTITRDGRLRDQWGNDCEPDGYVRFYARDSEGGPADADAGWREYRARFREGRLHSITRLAAEAKAGERYSHYGLASFRWFAPSSAD